MGNSIGCKKRSESSQQQEEKNKIQYRLLDNSNSPLNISKLEELIKSGNKIKNTTPQDKTNLLEITAINEFWQTLNDPTKSKEVRDFALQKLCEKGYKVAKVIDGKTTSIEHIAGNFHIKEAGQFDDNYKLISGSKEHIETGDIENCKVCFKHIYRVGDRKILTLQSFKSPTTGKEVVFRGNFDETHLDRKATLLNGVIEYKQQENYTKINVKDGKIVSVLDYFQKDGVTTQLYFDFENTQESSVKSYQKGRKHEVNIKEVAEKFAKQKPNCLSIKAENLTCIDEFRKNCIQEVQKTVNKTKRKKDKPRNLEKTTTEEDLRNIDDLVEYINGPQSFVKNALKARQQQSSASSSSEEPSQNKLLSTIDVDDDADTLVKEFYKQQQKLHEQLTTKIKKTPPRTTKISQAHEIKEVAQNLIKAVLPEIAFAPSQDSDTTATPSQASSSGLEQPTTPSATCFLPKRPDFYSIFEVSFLSEVLQAVSFVLNEDSPQHATHNPQTRDYYYNLLHNITNTSSVNGISLEYLCEGLRLAPQQTETLTIKMLKKAQDNYNPQMDEFARLSALQKAYEQANRSYQTAQEKWRSGEAIKEQQQDMGRE